MPDLTRRRNEELARILARLGWTPERLAAEVNAVVGRQDAINRTTPYHWRDRGRVPRAPYDQVVCEVLSRALGIAVTYQQLWSAMGSRRGARQLSAGLVTDPWTAAYARTALAEAASDDRPVRLARPADLFRPDDVRQVGLHWARSPGDPPVGDGALRVDLANLEDLRRSSVSKHRLEMAFGGGLVLDAARKDLGVAVKLIELGAYDERTGRALYGVAARLARLAGWACYDSRDDAAAQRHFIAALRAAHVSGDLLAGVSVLGCLAVQATFMPDREREAVTLLSTALDAADSALPAPERALHYGRMARALGRLGERPTAEAMADRAFAVLDEAGAALRQERADLHGVVGEGFLFLGDQPRARSHLEQAVAALAQERARARALLTVRLADSYRRSGDREKALRAAERARTMAAGMLSARVAAALEDLGRTLGAPTPV